MPHENHRALAAFSPEPRDQATDARMMKANSAIKRDFACARYKSAGTNGRHGWLHPGSRSARL